MSVHMTNQIYGWLVGCGQTPASRGFWFLSPFRLLVLFVANRGCWSSTRICLPQSPRFYHEEEEQIERKLIRGGGGLRNPEA